jgi:integrase
MKMQREHRVPLTAEAVALLEALPRLTGTLSLCPGSRGGQLSGLAGTRQRQQRSPKMVRRERLPDNGA